MKVDLADAARAGPDRDVRRRVALQHSRARRRPHGREGALYELAQWYPRVCVYDDLRGWNTEPYLGQGEFYLEYGDYNLVGHRAGRLHRRRHGHADRTRREVLTPTQISRLAQAAKSDDAGATSSRRTSSRAAPRGRRRRAR